MIKRLQIRSINPGHYIDVNFVISGYHCCFRQEILQPIMEFGVHYDVWYSEKTLADRKLIEKAVQQLEDAGHIYENNGARWFRSTSFGDEKDRVVIRDNGQATYFASDIAYHMDKFARGFHRVINIWGADHHGYVPRVKAAIIALGEDPHKLEILLVQFAILYRGGERVQMSTRSGSFVTLRELREEVGNDAARFFYVMRKCEQHMDFDLDLAKSQSNDNPVYYIQYAHARVCSVLRQLAEKNMTHDIQAGHENLSLLSESHETDLAVQLAGSPSGMPCVHPVFILSLGDDTLQEQLVGAQIDASGHPPEPFGARVGALKKQEVIEEHRSSEVYGALFQSRDFRPQLGERV